MDESDKGHRAGGRVTLSWSLEILSLPLSTRATSLIQFEAEFKVDVWENFWNLQIIQHKMIICKQGLVLGGQVRCSLGLGT